MKLFKSASRVCGAFIVMAVAATPTHAQSVRGDATLIARHLTTGFGTMWTFEAPPLEYWKSRYGFAPDQTWLDHARLAMLRLPGCSGSFVSESGLILTNHHCARSCAAAVSPTDTDYIQTGFVANAVTEERKCPGLFVDQLVGIEDVSARIAAAKARNQPGRMEIAAMREQCTKAGFICQVTALFQGGRYSLYRYRRFSDLRLVFVPEEQVAYYGGDSDNFTYPRYGIDVALLRAYENDQPYHPDHFLQWSVTGPIEGEAVFVVGNPGASGRLNTVAQMEYFRDVLYPTSLLQYKRQIFVLETLAARGAAERRTYGSRLFGAQNGFKSATGYLAGLHNERDMATKRAFETDLRGRVRARPELVARYGNPWRSILAAQDSARAISLQHRYYGFTATDHAWKASQIVRIVVQRQLPDTMRLAPYREANIAELERQLDQPIDTAYERLNTIAWFQEMQRELPANDPLLKAVFAGRTPEQAATQMLTQTRLDYTDFRNALLAGGVAAVQRSTDPFIVVARAINTRFTPLTERMQRYNETVAANAELATQAIYAIYGDALPPDATSSPRISDGVVAGYPYNGTMAPYKTSFYGLFARNVEFDGKGDFALPQRWLQAKPRIEGSTPLDFVTTNDIIGGNSGSPVINGKGEFVGVIFDNNIEGSSNRFFFADDVMRAVAVHARAIVETIRNVFGAARLADELVGRKP